MDDNDAVRQQIEADLTAVGVAESRMKWEANAEEWRRAAQSVARALGRPVQTRRREIDWNFYIMTARLLDWPSNDVERGVEGARLMRNADELAAATIEDPALRKQHEQSVRDSILAELRETHRGRVEVLLASGAEVENWRRQARAAGRHLRRPVFTNADGIRGYMCLTDWPTNPEERRAQSQIANGNLISWAETNVGSDDESVRELRRMLGQDD